MDEAAKGAAIKARQPFRSARQSARRRRAEDLALDTLAVDAGSLPQADRRRATRHGRGRRLCRSAGMRKRRCKISGSGRSVEPHLAMTDNVRAALAFVARGEAPLGIVYATDAAADPAVKIVATFPEDVARRRSSIHSRSPPSSHNGAAEKFLAYLKSSSGARDFRATGLQGSRTELRGEDQS